MKHRIWKAYDSRGIELTPGQKINIQDRDGGEFTFLYIARKGTRLAVSNFGGVEDEFNPTLFNCTIREVKS